MTLVYGTVEPSVRSMSTAAIRSGKTSSAPKISLTAEKGAVLEEVFSREVHILEQLAWRAVGNKLFIHVMSRKYSLHAKKVKQITEYLNENITELDTSKHPSYREKKIKVLAR